MVTKKPLIQIYCTTKEGHSVCVNVTNFTAYFYAELPKGLNETKSNLNMLKDVLNSRTKCYYYYNFRM